MTSKVEILQVPVNRKLLSDLFVTTMESGYSPWVHEAKLFHVDFVKTPSELLQKWGRAKQASPDLVWWGHEELYECEFVFELRYDRKEDEEGAGRGVVHVRVTDLVRGLQVLATKGSSCFGQILDDNLDGPSADAWLQCVIFGEVIYG